MFGRRVMVFWYTWSIGKKSNQIFAAKRHITFKISKLGPLYAIKKVQVEPLEENCLVAELGSFLYPVVNKKNHINFLITVFSQISQPGSHVPFR